MLNDMPNGQSDWLDSQAMRGSSEQAETSGQDTQWGVKGSKSVQKVSTPSFTVTLEFFWN